jgi:hypothetical protein
MRNSDASTFPGWGCIDMINEKLKIFVTVSL